MRKLLFIALFVGLSFSIMLGCLAKYPSSLLDLKSDGDLPSTRKILKENGFVKRVDPDSDYREVWKKKNMLGSHYAELNLSADFSGLEIVNIGYDSSIPILNRKRYMEKSYLLP